jgi:hypothetical protein
MLQFEPYRRPTSPAYTAAPTHNKTRLLSRHIIAGHFSTQVTMSTAQLVRPVSPDNDQGPALERKELVGPQITVNKQPPVVGAGVSGSTKD